MCDAEASFSLLPSRCDAGISTQSIHRPLSIEPTGAGQVGKSGAARGWATEHEPYDLLSNSCQNSWCFIPLPAWICFSAFCRMRCSLGE